MKMRYDYIRQSESGLTNNLEVFGADLRKKRRLWRMSQRRLAELAGTTQATVALIEGGRANPTYDLLTRIVGVFNLDVKLTIVRRPNRPVNK